MVEKDFNINQLTWFSGRAAATYKSEADIRATYSKVTHVIELTDIDVQYFIEDNASENQQIVAIRGTANKINAVEDAEYLQTKNSDLGVYLHDGFNKDSAIVYKSLLQYLDKSKEIVLTGHSLGAAISTILMMYLHKDGYTLANSVNFGQPKVTNTKGVEKYKFLPLTRVVDENDVVPLVPCVTLLDSIHGRYQHFGEQLTLLKDQYYAYLPQEQASEISLDSFSDNLKNLSVTQHFMEHYIQHISSKESGAIQVPYKQREKYID